MCNVHTHAMEPTHFIIAEMLEFGGIFSNLRCLCERVCFQVNVCSQRFFSTAFLLFRPEINVVAWRHSSTFLMAWNTFKTFSFCSKFNFFHYEMAIAQKTILGFYVKEAQFYTLTKCFLHSILIRWIRSFGQSVKTFSLLSGVNIWCKRIVLEFSLHWN